MAYDTVKIGDLLDSATLMGPVNSQRSIDLYLEDIERVQKEGGKVLCCGKRVDKKGFLSSPQSLKFPKMLLSFKMNSSQGVNFDL